MVPKWKRGKKILLLLSFFGLIIATEAQDQTTSKRNTSSARPEETLLRVFSNSFLPQDGTVSSDCQRDAAVYRTALFEYKTWALQMYDSSTKIPSGLITGNYKQLGNYEECLQVRSDRGFAGKACSPKVRFETSDKLGEEPEGDQRDLRDLFVGAISASVIKNWIQSKIPPYEWLWCVPSSCSAQDVARTIEIGLEPLRRTSVVDFTVILGNDSCHTQESDRVVFEVADWIYTSLLVLFGMIIAASTAYDLVVERSPAKPDPKDTKYKIRTAFSLYTNGKNLLDVRRGADSIDCLDGIRFLSICWIIYGHTANLKIDGIPINFEAIPTMYERWDTLIFLNNNIGTDSFFLLSGTLLAYSELGKKRKNPDSYKFSLWNLYLHRYIRLTVSYAMVIGFYSTLLTKLGTGPRWNQFAGMNSEHCKESWWTNLLYVNNYVKVDKICIQQSWYLSADMQMVWLSPILLYPMLAKGKWSQIIFFTLLILALVATILTVFLVTYFHQLTGTMLFYQSVEEVVKVYLEIYTRVYTRCGPYLVGIALGYFLMWSKHRNSTMPVSLAITGWVIATGAGLAVVFGPREFYLPQHQYNVVEASFYAGFHRPVFASTIAWIIIASVYGYAGPVGTLLSWSAWAPFSKLTYSAYLTHYIVLLYDLGVGKAPDFYTTFDTVHAFFGNLVLSLVLSLILYLCFEMPFCQLDRLLISGSSRPTFVTSSYAPTRDPFRTKDSSNPEIYRPTSLVSSISNSYDDFMDSSTRVMIDSEHPRLSREIKNASSNSSIDLNGSKSHRASGTFESTGSPNSKHAGGVDNLAFDKS